MRPPGINATVQAVFRSKVVVDATDRAELLVLRRQGFVVRSAALKQLKPGGKKNIVSKPGESPRGHLGLLKRHMRYEVDTAKKHVDIGPERLQKPGLAPATLEHGGQVELVTKRRKKRVTIKPRPFMGPALAKSQSLLTGIWRDSIRG